MSERVRGAGWGADADVDGAGGALARLTQTTNPAGARVHSPEEGRGRGRLCI